MNSNHLQTDFYFVLLLSRMQSHGFISTKKCLILPQEQIIHLGVQFVFFEGSKEFWSTDRSHNCTFQLPSFTVNTRWEKIHHIEMSVVRSYGRDRIWGLLIFFMFLRKRNKISSEEHGRNIIFGSLFSFSSKDLGRGFPGILYFCCRLHEARPEWPSASGIGRGRNRITSKECRILSLQFRHAIKVFKSSVW